MKWASAFARYSRRRSSEMTACIGFAIVLFRRPLKEKVAKRANR
jgi:hypothetical protein